MARIIRIIAVIASCCACAGLIYFSSIENNTGVYGCMIGCFVGFLVNMLATARENRKILEQAAETEAEQTKK